MSQSKLPSALKTYSVLPDNKSALERALELSLSNQLYSIPIPYPGLLTGQNTPLVSLPYLGLEKQVSDWDSDDPEQEKRAQVSNQWPVFSHSGKVSGIKLALESFGGSVDVKKWYQFGGDPYHLKIVAWVKKPPSETLLSRVSSRLSETISVRDTFDIGIGFQASGSVYAGGAVISAPRVLVGPWVPPIIESSGVQYVGGAVQSVMRVIVNEYRSD